MIPRRVLPGLWLAGTAVALAGFLVLRAWSPRSDSRNSICFFRRELGVACPTCGLTRAFADLAKGRYADASRLHPLALPLAVELGIAWGIAGFAIARPGWRVPYRAGLVALAVTVAAFLAVWIYRLATGTLPP